VSSRRVDEYLENLGYAPVLVMVGRETRVGAAASSEPSRRIEENFLPAVPEGAKTSLDEIREEQQQIPPYRFFPRLGVYFGYMDKQGIRKTEEEAAAVAKVYAAEYLSLIRPVFKRLAESTGNLTWGLERLGIDKIWQNGLYGKGVRVGQLDTGVDASHEALHGRVKGFVDIDYDGNIISDSRPPGDAAYDSDDHGTHTAGTICGGLANGMAIGVAPKADLYVALVIEGGNALLRVLQGMEWCIGNQVKVLSMSLGFRGYTPFFTDVMQRLRANGVLPVIAIGNEGRGFSRSPGNYPEALSIGAIDSNDHVARFSSSIRFNRDIEPYQPDCVAPGVNVISAKPGGGVQAMSGTSMATPHAAGVTALLFESQPAATADQIEKAILDTCKPLAGERKERYGHGLIDPVAAIAMMGGNKS
jgi:subtilisin